jgi:hypothetical protein
VVKIKIALSRYYEANQRQSPGTQSGFIYHPPGLFLNLAIKIHILNLFHAVIEIARTAPSQINSGFLGSLKHPETAQQKG